MSIKNFTLRIDEHLLDIIKTVAQFEGRSVNSRIIIVMQRYIKVFVEKQIR